MNPAIEMKLTEKLALDVSFGYAGVDFTFQDAGNNMAFGISLYSLGFGLTYDL